MENELFKRLATILFLVKKINEKYPSKQIGKTLIQKMMYLIKREGVVDYTYSMYHYGPFSNEVSSDLNLCEALGMLTIDWNIDKGYIIKRKEDQSGKESIYEKELSNDDKNKIEKIVEEYGSFSTKELSIITTAIFLKEEESIKSTDDLVKIVFSLKPDYSEDFIREILKKSRVIS
jgi:uncharacterized protein YwgA